VKGKERKGKEEMGDWDSNGSLSKLSSQNVIKNQQHYIYTIIATTASQYAPSGIFSNSTYILVQNTVLQILDVTLIISNQIHLLYCGVGK